MKVIELHSSFGLDQLTLAERPEPTPGRLDVIVKMRAAALNYRDLQVVRGDYPTAIRLYDITLRPVRRPLRLRLIVDPPEPLDEEDRERLIQRLNDGNDKPGVLVVREITGEDRVDVWGTDIYTGDSNLAAAAVHAGLLKVGETGWICREVVPTLKSYTGTTRNGVASNSYGEYPIAVKLRRVAGPAPAHRLEPHLGVRQPAEMGWSEPMNQLQARLVLVEEGKDNSTPQVVPYLELRTAEGALQVRKDEDAKLRYIAMRALAGKVNAFPAGASAEAFTDMKSDEHRKMVQRFTELVTRLAD